MENRKQVFKALVGSWNYNLAVSDPSLPTEYQSDKDYKVFHVPTFEDLYKGEMFHEQTITATEDHDCHDIRKLPMLLWKANLSYLEVLYSIDLKFTFMNKELTEIMSMRDQIVTMNLPHLYNACIGQYKNKVNSMYKGTEGTRHLVERYGYDTKTMLHASRNLDFLHRFIVFEYDFERALRYTDSERVRFMDIKNGLFTDEQIIDSTNRVFEKIEKNIKADYMSHKPNVALKEKLDQLVMELVRKTVSVK